MSYQPIKPNHLGSIKLKDISFADIVPFIDWTFFFMAWRISGKFEGIDTAIHCDRCKITWLQKFNGEQRTKAEEALNLYRDAVDMLKYFKDENLLQLHASICFYPAHSIDDDIIVDKDGEKITLPTLRQQHPSTDGFCYALADFIAPESDYLGAFVTTVLGGEDVAAQYENDDVYKSILVKTLCDRIAEALAEWVHWKVRIDYWGYDPDENLSVSDMLKTRFSGIRPAVGYPSLPDQSIIFRLDPLLEFSQIGVTLTENGAMYPNASVCGLYFAHPQSKYFMVGKIDNQQLQDYAVRCGKKADEIKKWLVSNL